MEIWINQLLTWLALPEFGLSTVFVVSFISATLLPMGSEPVVFGLVTLNPSLFWPAILVATFGNTLGGAVTWWMGLASQKVVSRLQHNKTDLRALAWLERLQRFRPHLGGAVWRGTATRHSDIFIQLFCDDSKAAEIALIDMGVRFEVSAVTGFQGEMVDALSVHVALPSLKAHVGVHLMVYDHDDLRGALRPDARGLSPRGDLAAVAGLLAAAD